MRGAVSEAKAQFDPFQMKYGTAALPDMVTTPPGVPVAITPQIAVASGNPGRVVTSDPFSFSP